MTFGNTFASLSTSVTNKTVNTNTIDNLIMKNWHLWRKQANHLWHNTKQRELWCYWYDSLAAMFVCSGLNFQYDHDQIAENVRNQPLGHSEEAKRKNGNGENYWKFHRWSQNHCQINLPG